MKIEIIPIGKENKLDRKQLMEIAHIHNENIFKKDLAELRKKYIILFNEGYYRPSTKQEYIDFINKCNETKTEMYGLMVLAKKEMEELTYGKSLL